MNRRIYHRAVFDDYISFYDLAEDLNDICLELTDVGINVFSERTQCLEFYHSKVASWNISECMDESIVDEVIDRLKVYMDSKNYDISVHKTYYHSYSKIYFFHRLINRYKGKLSGVILKFYNRNERPLECWDIVANEGFGRITHT